MIKLTNLTKSYSGTIVVDNLNLEVKSGSVFGFLGPNGAGKTTTIKMIMGLSKISDGTISVNNKKVDHALIGYMPEDPYFYDHLSAKEFLSLIKELFGKRKTMEIDGALELVGLQNTTQQISEFSKGMKQRLGLAQAIINNPDYLFLDEPLDGLDPIGRLEFKEIILKLKKQGKTIFFNSHILSDVEEICDEIGILNKGKLIYSGPVKDFCQKETLEKRFVTVITSANRK